MSRRAFVFGLIVVALLVVSLYRAKYGARDAAAEIAQLEEEIADARARRALLQAELSHMSRREWIEEYARHELGMRPARAHQFVSAGDLDTRVGPPGPAPGPEKESAQ